MTVLAIVLLHTATYRLTRNVVEDDFPLKRPREWLQAELKGPRGWLGDLVSCPWCVSVWLGAGLVAAVARWFESVPLPVLVWLSCSAFAGFLSSVEPA